MRYRRGLTTLLSLGIGMGLGAFIRGKYDKKTKLQDDLASIMYKQHIRISHENEELKEKLREWENQDSRLKTKLNEIKSSREKPSFELEGKG